jgi:hypothetical protein
MTNCSVAARSPSVAGAGCCPAFDVTIVRILTIVPHVVNSPNVTPSDRLKSRLVPINAELRSKNHLGGSLSRDSQSGATPLILSALWSSGPHRTMSATLSSRGHLASILVRQAVGTVPPSITYSVPVMEPARGEATNAMRSATSRGLAGRPSGMPPSDRMMICLPPS